MKYWVHGLAMSNIIKLMVLVVIFATNNYSQNLTDERAKTFIEALIHNSDDVENYFDTSELKLSGRLGISYKNIKDKFLISIDIDAAIKKKLSTGELAYEYKILNDDDNHSRLMIKIPKENISWEYTFHNSMLASRPMYYTQNWTLVTSKYFVIHASDPKRINDYAINQLDAFVERMLRVLNCSSREIQKLRERKIQYFLCKDDSEIKLLTNYSTRGLYYIAADYIVSIFNSHYHEIAHLLMNYKLQSVNLYTLPLLQEGFAAAFGGRGGVDRNVILSMGTFLVKSNFTNYNMLLNKNDFSQYDASLTYPVAGLNVEFLIETLGIENFIKLYIKYSSDADKINQLNIVKGELPAETEWLAFVSKQSKNKLIYFANEQAQDSLKPIVKSEDYSIYKTKDEYLVKLKCPIGVRDKANHQNYTSTVFEELFPKGTYRNEKYIIIASNEEVSVYNLFTNNLIAKYVKGFSAGAENVPLQNGYYTFVLKKELFDKELRDYNIIGI